MAENTESEIAVIPEAEKPENENEETPPEEAAEEQTEEQLSDDDEIDDFTIDEQKPNPEPQPEPDTPETTEAEEIPKKKFPKKPVLITLAAVLAAAAIAYGAGVWYYSSHFFFNTTISGSDCSNMTVEEANEKVRSDIKDYKFVLNEKGGATEEIAGNDISLEYTAVDGISDLKKKQNPFKWFIIEDETRNMEAERKISMNEESLNKIVDSLKCVTASNESMNGMTDKVSYSGGSYSVDGSGADNIISRSKLYEKIKSGIDGLYSNMSLEDEGCYVGVEGEDRMKAALETMNKYVAAKITYKKGGENIVLDGDTINKWVSLSSDYAVTLNDGAVNEYVSTLADKFNTVGKSRPFKTSGGSSITVSGGDYGWRIDSGAEENKLIELIKNGEQVEREPEFRQRGAEYGPNNDLPATYVEVSIGGQHVWAYKNGSLIVSTDCVTGDPTKNRSTDTGVYYIKYKERNATLKGEDYSTPVSFWMPFNGGQGLHDLNRGVYGGSIYKGNGSHGCVNLPYGAAQTIYENFPSGDKISIHKMSLFVNKNPETAMVSVFSVYLNIAFISFSSFFRILSKVF